MMLLKPRIVASAPQTAKKIRVAFVIDTLSRAGTETQLLALIQKIDRDRFEPWLVLLDGTSPESISLEPDCKVLRLGVKRLVSRKAWRARRQLKQQWRYNPPDIVQAYFLDSAYFAVPLAKQLGVKNILRVRNNLGYWLTCKHRLLDRLMRPMVRATLTNCDSARDSLVNDGHRDVVVLENGVDLQPVMPLPAATIIGCVANLRAVKNIDGLLRAAAMVHQKRPTVRFAIAGDGPERGTLEKLRDSLGLKDAVTFHGSVHDIPRFLARVSFVVLPSHSEGLSNALLEAMAAGRTVIATDVGANARVLGDAGVIVEPRNDEALAKAMIEMTDSESRMRMLGRIARERVEAAYSRTAMVRRFEEYYESLVH